MTFPATQHMLAAPVHIDLNLTNGCDMMCRHCHSASGARDPGELETRELRALISELHGIGVMSIVLAGGEPLLRPDAVELLSHACSLPGWQVGLVTNGLALTRPDICENLAARCPGLVVNVSLEGTTPADNDLLRQHRKLDSHALFDKICSAILCAVGAGLDTSCNITMNKKSARSIGDFHEFAVGNLGVRSVVAIKFVPIGYGAASRNMLELSFDEWQDAFLELTRRRLEGELRNLRISVPAAWDFYLPLILAGIDLAAAENAWGYKGPLRAGLLQHLGREIGDTAGITEIAIGPAGDVYPTILSIGDERCRCGNVREHSPLDIWRHSDRLSALRNAKISDLGGGCRSCAISSICGGGSRARAAALSGELMGPDLSCPLIAPADPGCGPRQEVSGRSASGADAGPPASARVLAVIGTGRSAMRVMRYGSEYELRGGWQVTPLSERQAREISGLETTTVAEDPVLGGIDAASL